ncbi:TonB-dependent receptor [Chitinophaga sp. XS-30]|uniref:TonB-dependent receptor n=1 Tax=Chitinophaga sp. XS-30 TaxID=2604421 RepID=UPI0011DDBE5F|nr:TonB-dependent receptor [Chitinophaga sp. XS-30]QEH43816.1 TonB-dependent receptor [Chitinophaga sp. XS-30]
MMIRKIALTGALLQLLLVASASAQCTIRLSGTITDTETRQVLSGASITVKETGQAVQSDASGAYLLEGLCPGNYTVRVSHIGCVPVEIAWQVIRDERRNIALPHSITRLQEVAVTGHAAKEVTTAPVETLSGRELDKTRGLTLGDALKRVNGVTTMTTGPNVSKPVINGLHSNRILILNNGIRQEGQQWGSEHAPEVDPFLASKLIVIKGAGSLRYGGDAIGGVVLAEPKPLPVTPGLGGEVNFAGFSNNRLGAVSAILEQQVPEVPGLSWRLQGTVRKGGNTRTPDYWLDNTGVEELNFSVAAGWKRPDYGVELFYSQFNTSLGVFEGSHIGNRGDLEEVIRQGKPRPEYTEGFSYEIDRPYQRVEHELFKIKSFLNTGEAGRLNLVLARQFNYRDELDRNSALSVNQMNLNLTTYNGELVWDHHDWKGLRGTVGATGMYQDNSYQRRLFVPNYESLQWGAFWTEKWESSDNKWLLEGGIRYDNKRFYNLGDNLGEKSFPEQDFSSFSGSLGAQYRILDHFHVSLNAARAWRAAAVNELYATGLHHGAAVYVDGDPYLDPEIASKFNLSLHYDIGEKLEADVNLYYNYIRNFIFQQPTDSIVVTIRGAFPYTYFRQSDVSMKGMDAQLRWHFLPKWQLSTKASILRAWNETDNDWLIAMPSDRFEHELSFFPGNTKRLKENYISLSVSNVLEQTRTPANLTDKSDPRGQDLMAPPAGYTLLNLEAGSTLQLGGQPLSVIIGAGNLLNARYRDYMNFFRYFADEPGTNVYLKLKLPLQFRKNKS